MLAAACATGGATLDRELGPHAAVRFEVKAADESDARFPAAKNPRLPSADHLADVIKSRLGGTASADVWLCVAPDGHVQGLSLVRGSSLAAFDAAVLHDAADWQFSGNTFASSLRTCGTATISYRPAIVPTSKTTSHGDYDP